MVRKRKPRQLYRYRGFLWMMKNKRGESTENNRKESVEECALRLSKHALWLKSTFYG
jgi:hypothetical protein